jgi:hypothetical protein
MYFDRSLMKTGVGAGLVFISPLEVRMRYVIRLHYLMKREDQSHALHLHHL